MIRSYVDSSHSAWTSPVTTTQLHHVACGISAGSPLDADDGTDTSDGGLQALAALYGVEMPPTPPPPVTTTSLTPSKILASCAVMASTLQPRPRVHGENEAPPPRPLHPVYPGMHVST